MLATLAGILLGLTKIADLDRGHGTSTRPHFALGLDWITVVVVVGAVYYTALLVAWKRVRHPARRAAAFLAGMAALLVAFVSPLDEYVNFSFFAHMTQHAMLIFAVAPLIALGAPITVALEATPSSLRREFLLPILASPVTSLVTHPVLAWLSCATVQTVIQFTPFFNTNLNTSSGHTQIHVLYLVTGFLFWWPIIGVDPTPRERPFPTRLAALALLMVFEGSLGLVILSASAPLYAHYASLGRPWGGGGALASQHKAGWVLLIGGVLSPFVAALSLLRRGKQLRQGSPGCARHD